MRSMTPPESPWLPRFGATESSSSKKMTHGLASRARWNTRRTLASDSPMYMLSSSGPLTEKKLSEHDVATALARSVLPVPGGPYRRIPACQKTKMNQHAALAEERAGRRERLRRRTAALLEPVAEQLWPLERQLDRVEDVALDAREAADVVPRHVGDLGRADALAVGRSGLVERAVEVERGEGDAGVGEVGECRCR